MTTDDPGEMESVYIASCVPAKTVIHTTQFKVPVAEFR